MFARFDENPATTFQDIKETKRYGRTHRRTDNVKTVYPPPTKFAGGIKHLNIYKIHWTLYIGVAPITHSMHVHKVDVQKFLSLLVKCRLSGLKFTKLQSKYK